MAAEGIEATALVEVQTAGPLTRIIFRERRGEFYFQVPTAELRGMMPMLARATNPAGDDVTAITAVAVDAAMDRSGNLLLTLVNTAGARMTFGLDRPQTVSLSALVDEALQVQSGSTGKH